MRLTRLDLTGFKSFARKTELQFGSGITAVIGPNGSGKSNISDAVRWVLGEQSAKALRGTKMEDVIFNGTQKRRPQSGCEVTLTFDNSDHALALEFDNVAVTRRVYRSGESEYLINGRVCRLKDVLELFRDTGIGKDGYSIISQGKVDEILSNKSNDRRAALEEAAGVMRYRVRKEEAERKLEQTQKNMERIADVMGELESRIEPLREQSETARQFLKLRDELKDLDINMFLYQTDRYGERIGQLQDAVMVMERDMAVNEENDRQLVELCASLEQAVHTLDGQVSGQQNTLLQMLSGVEAHQGECNLLLERRENAKKERIRVAEGMTAASERRTHLSDALALLSAETPDTEKQDALQKSIAALTSALDAMDADISLRDEALERAKNAIMEEMNRLSDARIDRTRIDAMELALRERLAALDAETEKLLAQQTELAREHGDAETERRALEAARADKQAELTHAQENRAACEKAFLTAQQAQHELEQQKTALESRVHVLGEMVKSREGYQNSVKLLLRDAEEDGQLRACIKGVVAELITVPKEYETAIGMSLGGSLQNIVTPTARDAKRVIEHLRAKDYGRATMLPMSLLTPNPLNDKERRLLSVDGCVGVASELVEASAEMRGVVEYLLGRTVIVRDLDSGVALKEKAGNAFHIATLLGDFISTGGTMTGGSVKKGGFGMLGREREWKELQGRLKDLAADSDRRQVQTEAARQQLLLADLQIDAFSDAVHDADVALARHQEKTEIIGRDREQAAAREASQREQRADILETLADLENRKVQSETLQESISRSSDTTREDVMHAQQAQNALRQEREQRAQELTELRISEMALQKETHAREKEKERLTREICEQDAQIRAGEAMLVQLDLQDVEAERRLSEMQQSVAGEQQDATAAREEQQRLEKERAAAAERLSQHRQERDALTEGYRSLGEKKHKTELTLNRLELERNAMQDRIWQEYELTYENAQAFRHDFPVGVTNARIAELRAGIRELGDINVSSIEDYTLVTERYDGLKTQFDDLEQAKTDLYQIIGQLIGTMQEVFVAEFAKVQQNFADVFAELFGGGMAELRLSDPRDVLNCEIEIIAQPPGKKLQLLSLLSGGERALTAIALLFAMLRLKAPAFCVLDEIETSLDEANVTRFAAFLKRYAQTTQFIIITHRKGSMEACDTLYGVAMEEKGVSSIVSARFGEAS